MSCNEKRISSEGGRPIQAQSSQFYSEWWQFGAPIQNKTAISYVIEITI
jgi:mevalonate pyrophosphate decarboxylase